MGNTTASVGNRTLFVRESGHSKDQISKSIGRLSEWLEKDDYRGHDTFDGLSAEYVRRLTFETKFLGTVLQQGVRRFPINLRPLLGIQKSRPTKGWAIWPRALSLHRATGPQCMGGYLLGLEGERGDGVDWHRRAAAHECVSGRGTADAGLFQPVLRSWSTVGCKILHIEPLGICFHIRKRHSSRLSQAYTESVSTLRISYTLHKPTLRELVRACPTRSGSSCR